MKVKNEIKFHTCFVYECLLGSEQERIQLIEKD